MQEHGEVYGKIAKELIEAFELYDSSVVKIVDVWKEMLNNSDDLQNTFYLLIMTEFVETIWDDNNIKVVIEEILRNQKDLSNYAADVEKMMEISEKLNDISQKYNKSYDSKSDSSHTMCSSECLHEGT